MSKASRGDKSFQSGAGKGDASRITDVATYRQNYDEIDWRTAADKEKAYKKRVHKAVAKVMVEEGRKPLIGGKKITRAEAVRDLGPEEIEGLSSAGAFPVNANTWGEYYKKCDG